MPETAGHVAPEAADGPSATTASGGETEAALAAGDVGAPRRRVLLLTHRMPYPPDRGDRIRAYHLMKLLAREADLSVACTSEEAVWLQHHHLLRRTAKRVAIQPVSPSGMRIRAAAAMLRGHSATPASFFRLNLAEEIVQWHEQQPFDAVVTFCTGMIGYTQHLLRYCREHGLSRPVHVLDLVDVDSIKWESYGKSTPPPMRWVYATEAKRLRRIEAGELERFDAITVISDAEADAYRKAVGDDQPVHVVGNGVDFDYFEPLPDAEGPTVCFVGVLNYRPNGDAVAWFVRNVMPPLRERFAEARMLIVGRNPTPAVEAIAEAPGVELVGSVPDVRDYIAKASVIIAPLLLARGVQNKVLEAMACERAVVCSPAAAQGIDAEDGEHLLVAKTAEEWVNRIGQLFDDAAARRDIAHRARQRVITRYDWADRLQPMLKLLRLDPVSG